jgi:hypothetical protein
MHPTTTHAPNTAQVLDLSYNHLQQLPAAVAALPRLRALLVPHNLITELPRLPPSLSRLDVSYNRLKGLSAPDLLRLTALTSAAFVRAFSHPPRGEAAPAVGALARLAAARGAGLTLRCDGAVAELVRTRARLGSGSDGWGGARVVGD